MRDREGKKTWSHLHNISTVFVASTCSGEKTLVFYTDCAWNWVLSNQLDLKTYLYISFSLQFRTISFQKECPIHIIFQFYFKYSWYTFMKLFTNWTLKCVWGLILYEWNVGQGNSIKCISNIGKLVHFYCAGFYDENYLMASYYNSNLLKMS